LQSSIYEFFDHKNINNIKRIPLKKRSISKKILISARSQERKGFEGWLGLNLRVNRKNSFLINSMIH
jgi:hypothetical protein